MAYIPGRRRDRIVGGFTTTCGKVPITTEVVRWNPAHGELYSIQYYVIKFVVSVFPSTPVSSTNKTDILLKGALNTINQTLDLNIVEILLDNHSINLPEVINIIR